MKDKKLRAALSVKTDGDGEITVGDIERLELQIENLAAALGYRIHYSGGVSKQKNN